jgi:small-conductance mechanosensitive channel
MNSQEEQARTKNMIQAWSMIITQGFQSAWDSIVFFLPKFLGALVIFIIGWFIAIWLGKLVSGVLNQIKFNDLFSRTGWKEALEKAEIKILPSDFLGAIIKWIVVVIFLMVATDILEWVAFADLLQRIIIWIPNLLVAIIILVVAIILADILEKIVKASAQKMGISFVNFLGSVVRWGIYIFALLAALLQIGVASAIVNTLVIGFVTMIALAFGLSFGLGGKEIAGRLLEEWKSKMMK